MTWPAYGEYKDAGVEWLDKVPTSWQMQKIRRICSFTTGWTPPSGDDASYDGDNPWANISDLGPRKLADPKRRISDSAVEAARISLSPTGSLLFSFKLSIGQVSFAGRDMYTNEAIATFVESDALDLRFAYYSFPFTLVKNANENIYGAKLLNQEIMNAARIPLPPADQQRAIADVLDHETAKIDTLISRQERLIATLREDRAASIIHTVTKGLDPYSEMKCAGPELPSSPAHWETHGIKRFGRLVTGGTPSTAEQAHYTEDADGLPWFRPEDIDTTGRPSIASRFLSQSGTATVPLIAAPSVLVVSIGATLGKTGYVEIDATSNQQITAVVGAPCAKFVYYALVASNAQIWACSMGNTLPIISGGRLGAIKVPVPPLEEQRHIVQFLDQRCERVDALISKANQMIKTLREYRFALIANAVTGKIDVRGVV